MLSDKGTHKLLKAKEVEIDGYVDIVYEEEQDIKGTIVKKFNRDVFTSVGIEETFTVSFITKRTNGRRISKGDKIIRKVNNKELKGWISDHNEEFEVVGVSIIGGDAIFRLDVV